MLCAPQSTRPHQRSRLRKIREILCWRVCCASHAGEKHPQVYLAVWRSMDRFNQSAPADGLVEMSSSLAQSSSSFKKTWLRLGVSIYASEDEIDKLMTDCDDDILRKIIADGRWRPDGESYIPEVTVEEYNAANGTFYEGEPEFNL